MNEAKSGYNLRSRHVINVQALGRVPRLLPLLPFTAYWALTLLYYHIGFVVTPSLHVQTYLYIALGVFLCILGFRIQTRNERVMVRSSAPFLQRREKWVKGLLVIAFAGNVLLLLDKIRAGVSLSVVVNETQFLRDDYGTSVLTTAAVPFAGFLYPAVAGFFLFAGSNQKISKTTALLGCATVGALLLTTVLSGNRAHILHFVFWMIFLLGFVTWRGLPGDRIANRRRIARLMLVIGMLGATAYTIFISSFRISTDFLQNYERGELLRYNAIESVSNQRVQGGLVLLSGYATQQYEFVDTIIKNAPFIRFDLSPFVLWHNRQLARIGITDHEETMRAYAIEIGGLGLSEFGWPSVFGHLMIYFGSMGGLIWMFIFGTLLGYFTKSYWRTGRLWALAASFQLYSFLNYSYMAVPADHNFAIGTLIILGLAALKV